MTQVNLGDERAVSMLELRHDSNGLLATVLWGEEKRIITGTNELGYLVRGIARGSRRSVVSALGRQI